MQDHSGNVGGQNGTGGLDCWMWDPQHIFCITCWFPCYLPTNNHPLHVPQVMYFNYLYNV